MMKDDNLYGRDFDGDTIRKDRLIYDFNKYDDSKTHLYGDMNSKTHIYDGDFDGDTIRKDRLIYDFNKYDDSKTHLYGDMNSKTHIYDGDFDGDTVDRESMIRQNIAVDSNRKIISGLKDRASNINVDNVAKSGQILNDNFKDVMNQATDQFKD